ncbi:hypothetical protein llap_1543 [Limosa lapponica baueri]|uniref:Uncharacterized protein n=1 Tax=Limosa lapponica baueri TaxID=1758121 RepID=A0A2I0UQ56_LIMLA|nr:hypothetical protein llap_1543 [Limosa lapponica baueri]
MEGRLAKGNYETEEPCPVFVLAANDAPTGVTPLKHAYLLCCQPGSLNKEACRLDSTFPLVEQEDPPVYEERETSDSNFSPYTLDLLFSSLGRDLQPEVRQDEENMWDWYSRYPDCRKSTLERACYPGVMG